MKGRVLLLSFLLASAWFCARAGERDFTFILKGNFTTASRVFTDPNSPDPLERGQYFSLEDFFWYGIEARYRIPETNIAFGLSADYIKTSIGQSDALSTAKSVPVEDGYEVIPVEITGYFLIPVSGETFGIYMGGGVGGYFGRRLYKYGDGEAATTARGHGFGIHVLGGVSYRFAEWFSVVAEMKFRDLQFQTANQFSSPTVTYQGMSIAVSQEPKYALVHTDGVMFQLGTAFNF